MEYYRTGHRGIQWLSSLKTIVDEASRSDRLILTISLDERDIGRLFLWVSTYLR
jgi:hypothetical protein